MKKFNLFLAFTFASLLLHSQTPITINTADMPVVTDTIRYNTTNNIQGLDPTLTGANYTWDYSTLISSTERIDTFFSVTSTPFSYQLYFNNSILYPTYKANYALRGPDLVMPPALPIPLSITEVFNYKKNSTTKYENVGFGAKINGIPSSIRNNPIDVEYEFPMNYTDNHISNSKFLVTIPLLAVYGQVMERNSTVEGWGTLITPVGTYDVLKVKSVLTKIDTFYLDTLGLGSNFPRPEEIEYKWLAKGGSTPILKIVTTLGVVSSIEYQANSIVGINELSIINEVSVFPNPTKEFVQVVFNSKNAGKLVYSIKDINGRFVMYNDFVAHVGKNVFQMDLSKNKLSNGVYFIELLMNDQLTTQKLIISE